MPVPQARCFLHLHPCCVEGLRPIVMPSASIIITFSVRRDFRVSAGTRMEMDISTVELFCVLRYIDQQKNGTVSGFDQKMTQAYIEISGKLKKNKHGKRDLHKKIAEVVSKRLRYLLNGALIHAELYRSSLAKKSSSQFALAMAIKKVAKSASETAVSIDQFSRFIQMRGLFQKLGG